MYLTGIVELLLGGILLWKGANRATLLAVLFLMCYAIGNHLYVGTYDIGGAIFIGLVAMIVLILDRSRNGKSTEKGSASQ